LQPLLQCKICNYYIFRVCLWPQLSSVQSACAILSPLAYLALQYVSALSHKGKILRKKKLIKHEMCDNFVQKVSLKYFSFLEEFSLILSLMCIRKKGADMSRTNWEIQFCWVKAHVGTQGE